MPTTIELIRASKLPSNMMQFAAKGALSVSPEENLEILVYLAKNNKIFGATARMTLAGWDETASLAAASDPKTAREVLDYLIEPDNIRPKLLPALLENPSVTDSKLAKFAVSASRESIETMLKSTRVQASVGILDSLRAHPYMKPEHVATVVGLMKAKTGEVSGDSSETTTSAAQLGTESTSVTNEEPHDVPDEAISAY